MATSPTIYSLNCNICPATTCSIKFNTTRMSSAEEQWWFTGLILFLQTWAQFLGTATVQRWNPTLEFYFMGTGRETVPVKHLEHKGLVSWEVLLLWQNKFWEITPLMCIFAMTQWGTVSRNASNHLNQLHLFYTVGAWKKADFCRRPPAVNLASML